MISEPDGNFLPALALPVELTPQPALLLKALLESSPIGFLIIDNHYTILAFNELMNDFSRIAWKGPLQKNGDLLSILPTASVAFFRERYNFVMQGEKVCYEVAYPWGDGSSTNFDMNLVPVLDDLDAVIGCCLSSEDISVRVASGHTINALHAALEMKVKERTAQYETVNKELDAFTYSVSHDLRSPLRAVNSYAQILLEEQGAKLDADGLEILEHIRYNGQKMGRLIDELLAFSRLGRKEIDKEEIDMHLLAKKVLADLGQVSALKATIELEALPCVLADFTMMYQVLYNLIGNAVKYSSKRDHPVIKVYTIQRNGNTVFVVQDNGAGFDMRFADKLFGVFQRLHSEKQFEGNGVGLAIVQRILAKFGGEVWGEAEVDKGATFFFTVNK